VKGVFFVITIKNPGVEAGSSRLVGSRLVRQSMSNELKTWFIEVDYQIITCTRKVIVIFLIHL